MAVTLFTFPEGTNFFGLVAHLLYGIDLFEVMALEHCTEETARTKHVRRLRTLGKYALFCRFYNKRLVDQASGFGFSLSEAEDADLRVEKFAQKYTVKEITDPNDPKKTVGFTVERLEVIDSEVLEAIDPTTPLRN